jgi:hypothetical protein
MDAKFKPTAPGDIALMFSATATLTEWTRLAAALQAGVDAATPPKSEPAYTGHVPSQPQPPAVHKPAIEFVSMVVRMIREMEGKAVTEFQVTPWALTAVPPPPPRTPKLPAKARSK